jgi:hypothetical protein
MTDPSSPVTAAQLADALRPIQECMATKDDLQQCATKDDLQQCATKDDIQQFATKDDLLRFATKDDLKQCATKDDLLRFATKDDLLSFVTKEEFDKGIKSVNAGIDKVLTVLVNIDKRLTGNVQNHEKRIHKLELHTGLATAV